MSDNLKLWDAVARVPKEHLKGFTRGGGFKGTAIKPMWSIKTMTEQFGPCGTGWGVTKPDFDVRAANNETLVFCTVGVWAGKPDAIVYGVGGDKVVSQFSSGPKADDEAFKKAYTDAITNALKMLGVGADIHMGLWDGNKYVDEGKEKPAETPDGPAPMQASFGTNGQSKAASRDDYALYTTAIRNAPTLTALKKWYGDNAKAINELPPDFLDELRVEYNDRMAELRKVLAA